MYMEETMSFSGKKVLVMGLGLHGGGAGAVEFLARRRAKITVTDLRTARQLAPTIRALQHLKGIRYVLGKHHTQDFLAADVIIKNPGVRLDSPYLKAADAKGIPITSDMGIFFAMCPAQIIGVTGTRGKSTTTYLIWKLLKTKFGNRVHYGGNIRKSVLAILPRIKKGDLVVLELSSFQLQDLAAEKISPHIAVITNLLRDHLNWHRDMHEYAQAKAAIFRFQQPGNHLFINSEDAGLRRLVRRAPAHMHTVAAATPLGSRQYSPILENAGMSGIVDRNLGAHYRPSVALAIAVARHFGVPDAAIAKTVRIHKGLPARQELIATVRGVRFINDTTATIPDAAIAAIRRFRALAGSSHRLILIAGGQDKKLDFRTMAREMKKNVDAAVFLPGTATDILIRESRVKNQESRRLKSKSKVQSSKKYFLARSMEEAVATAWKEAGKSGYIVLSPGAASFGLFLNEFDRGDQFVQAVKKVTRKKK